MTAIAGLLRLDGAAADPAMLAGMRDALAPYGRDAADLLLRGPAGFARTLLRITPEDAADLQPLTDAASGCVLLFDGRLDNREELGDALGLARADLAGLPDSALALRACLRWDMAAPARLLGDFAIAMWQPGRGRLWLARSPLGLRPLFWHKQAGFFAFASMPKALLALPGVPRAVCEARLYADLAILSREGPESLFQEVFRVEPGHVLLLEGKGTSSRPFHRFDPGKTLRLARDQDYVEAFRAELDAAVARRLRTSGGIAAQLSSGFDSSTVVALAASRLATQGRGLTAFTAIPAAGFDGSLLRFQHGDESAGAMALSRRLPNVEHVLVRNNGLSACDVLEAEIAKLDRPPQNPSNAVWMGAIAARAVQGGARVMLTGLAGNLTISYPGKYLLPQLLREGRLRDWLREARAARRLGRRWRSLLFASVGPCLPGPAWNAVAALRAGDPALRHAPIDPVFMARMLARLEPRQFERYQDGKQARLATLHRVDPGVYYAAMNCHGIEMRDPTADLRLVEFLLSVPETQFARDGQSRWLLRRAMAHLLPPEITEARTKGLQSADWHATLGPALPAMRALAARARQSPAAMARLDMAALDDLLRRWPASPHEASRQAAVFHYKLMRGLAYAAFLCRFDDAQPPNAAQLPQEAWNGIYSTQMLFTPANVA